MREGRWLRKDVGSKMAIKRRVGFSHSIGKGRAEETESSRPRRFKKKKKKLKRNFWKIVST